MQHLASSNRRVTALRKLINSRKARHDERLFVVDGPRALSTIVETCCVVDAIFVDDEGLVDDAMLGDETAVFVLDRSVLESVADTQTPQGVLAVVAMRSCSLGDIADRRRVVVLDGVQDPGNVGAIVRVAAALGWDAVVACKGSGDPWSPKAVRASAGTVGMVDVVVDIGAAEAVAALGAAGIRLVGADMSPTVDLGEIDTSSPLALVLGAEGQGLSQETRHLLNDIVAVDMTAPVESLNVAVTGGIVMHTLR